MSTLLHVVSKLMALAWQPLSWVALILVIGVALSFVRAQRWRRWGRWLCAMALALLLLLGWYPLPDHLARGLEDRYQAPSGDLSGYTGMVVLGGAFRRDDGRERRQPSLGCAGERVVVPVPLMNQYPQMRLLFTGGDAAIFRPANEPEANVARAYFERMGTDMSRVLIESKSRNTYENATLSRTVPGVDIRQPWLLVTSAVHMPRALATFRKAGWNVTPYPVDYDSFGGDFWMAYDLYLGVTAWQSVLREYLGIAFYRLTGRL